MGPDEVAPGCKDDQAVVRVSGGARISLPPPSEIGNIKSIDPHESQPQYVGVTVYAACLNVVAPQFLAVACALNGVVDNLPYIVMGLGMFVGLAINLAYLGWKVFGIRLFGGNHMSTSK